MKQLETLKHREGWIARLGRWTSYFDTAMDISETSLLAGRVHRLECELATIRAQIGLTVAVATADEA